MNNVNQYIITFSAQFLGIVILGVTLYCLHHLASSNPDIAKKINPVISSIILGIIIVGSITVILAIFALTHGLEVGWAIFLIALADVFILTYLVKAQKGILESFYTPIYPLILTAVVIVTHENKAYLGNIILISTTALICILCSHLFYPWSGIKTVKWDWTTILICLAIASLSVLVFTLHKIPFLRTLSTDLHYLRWFCVICILLNLFIHPSSSTDVKNVCDETHNKAFSIISLIVIAGTLVVPVVEASFLNINFSERLGIKEKQ